MDVFLTVVDEARLLTERGMLVKSVRFWTLMSFYRH